MPFNKLPISFKPTEKTDIAALHDALGNMNFHVAEDEVASKKIEATTTKAIKEFQVKNNLPPDGGLNEKTISTINVELHDRFVTESKHRTEALQTMLRRLNLPVAKDELANRTSGASTRQAIEEVQKKLQLPVDGKVSENLLNHLQDEVIKAKLNASTQRGLIQQTLVKVNKVANLNLGISPDELTKKELGPTSQKVISEFQKKYRLPVTGTIDRVTLQKLNSVAASKGTFVKRIGKPKATELATINKTLSINKTSPAVNDAQKALSFLGYKIAAKEFNTKTFGKTTRQAVLAFQKSKGLPETGHLKKTDLKAINAVILGKNTNAAATSLGYHVRGSVRDELWQRKPNMVVRVYEKLLDGESKEPLASKKNFPNGFFNLSYNPPIDPVNGKVKDKFHLVVKFYEPVDNNPANDKQIAEQSHYNVNRIHWANLTQGDSPYRGESDFEIKNKTVQKAIGSGKIEDLHETPDDKQISQLALQTGLSTDAIMRLILAYRAAKKVNQLNPLSPEVFYGFIRQNFPPNLPGDLLRGTSDWETIDQLTELTGVWHRAH